MKKIYRLILSLLVLTFSAGMLNAQDRVVNGKVTDGVDGTALPGVNILEKGTYNGSLTDMNGEFSMKVNENAILVFSFVGFNQQEIEVGNQSTINVVMTPDIHQLQEVVVIGYGQQQKKDVTGVVETVKASEFNRGAIVSPEQLVAGKIAGVQITPNSGEPGGQVSIRIRGGTSIKASNEPLFVIDGVPIQNDAFSPGGFSSGRNPLNFLNPNDIESFTVLKDASAAAIYGSRAANGVIIITTKRGNKDDKGRLSYDGNYSVSENMNELQMLNAEEFRNVVTAKAPQNLDQLGNSNTDWFDEIFQYANGQNHSLSYSGGSDNTGFRASLGYQELAGVIRTSRTERYSLGLNVNSSLLNDRLTYNINYKGSFIKDRFAPGIVGNAASFDPTQSVFNPGSDSTGGYFEFVNNTIAVDNPVSQIEQTQEYGKTYRNIGNVEMEYKLPFLEGLSAKINAGFDITNGERDRFLPTTLESQRVGDNGEVRFEHMIRQNTLLDLLLMYKKDLPAIRSNIDITGGYSFQDFNGEFRSSRSYDLETDIFGGNSANPATQHIAAVSILENRLISFFGRVNYSLMDRYILTATLRRDGSTRFGDENKWGTFPSAAFAWRISEEAFASGLENIFSDLKLRLGYGVNGNQEIGDYLYLPTYTYSDSRAKYQFGDQYLSVLRPNAYDAGLKWEETTSYNAGLDFGVLKNRISGSIEYYIKKTEDLLFEVGVPVGANLKNILLTNIGSVENKGLEITLNGYIIDSEDLRWTLGANAAFNKNKITKLDNNNDPEFEGYLTGGISGGVGNNIQILSEGIQVNSFYVYKHKLDDNGNPLVDKVDHNDDGEINLADMYEDTNNDGVVNDKDRSPYKGPAPNVILGFTSNLEYKNFDLNFTLRANIGNYAYNNNASNYGNFDRLTGNTAENIHASALVNKFQSPQFFSDVYIEDASFLKMDNISLGYSFRQIKDANIRLYATVQNAFVFTNYNGTDPESGVGGIDNNLYPRARTYVFGVNIGF